MVRLQADHAAWRLRIELVRGWVHALALEDPRAQTLEERRPEAELERLALSGPASPRTTARAAQLLAASVRQGFSLTPVDEPRRRQGPLTPFHPLPVLREALEALFSGNGHLAERLLHRVETGGRPPSVAVKLLCPLHASALGPDELALVALLRRPRTWAELSTKLAAPRFSQFVRDAVLLGALSLEGDATLGAELHALARDPGPARAKEAARKRAYYAEARELHPDLHHAEDSDAEQRERARKMAELADKHRRGG